ncbi:MAG TPA: transketolase [Limnochordales bacterium]|nr:transketolase [Limnochordales bacterium]
MSILTTIAHTVRVLAADAVEKAQSGHPGLPLGCAEIGTALFAQALRHDPAAPQWPNRDRFVLSAGHGSMLLYALLHLSGYDLPMEELQRFRQLGSRTPGHPEYGITPGVETTTGPLGQGLANAVGMALAEAVLAQRFNRPGYPVVDHYTYVLASDGDMMEGVAAEAASLAGHLRLSKLIVVYDANRISIDGSTDLTFTESVADRFRAYGWHVDEVDGHDVDAVIAALAAARERGTGPNLIVARTRIGRHSLKEGSAESHGAPLGAEAVRTLKEALGFPPDPFHVPQEVYDYFADRRRAWTQVRQEWEAMFARWSREYPELRAEWDQRHSHGLPAELHGRLASLDPGKPVATREASGMALQVAAAHVPGLIGGSADLTPSNNSYIQGAPPVAPGDFAGRNIHFGVREHAMGAICNGMALHGGLRPYCATFLVFSDYMRPAIRMAALMGQPVIYILTHDSIYLGEDGPTHQPVEHLEALRVIPNLRVFRPATPQEVGLAWWHALARTDGPTALALTRQKVPVLPGAAVDPEGFARGGYVIRREAPDRPLQLVLIATGSEVALAWSVAEQLEAQGHGVRVVSMPCRELFLEQPAQYQEQVLGGPGVRRLTLEAGAGAGWYRLIRPGDRVYSLERFGESGPGPQVAAHLGFSVDQVLAAAQDLLDTH